MRLIHAIEHSARMVAEAATFKISMAAVGAGIAYLFPTEAIRESLFGAGFLLVVDSVTGIWASLVTGKPIESKRAVRVISKIVGYAAAAATVSVAFKLLPPLADFREQAINAVVWLVIATEAISILENVNTMGVRLPKWLHAALKGHLAEIRKAPTTDKTDA